MEQNIKDLYDYVGSLDNFNTDLSDVPQTGEKIRLTEAEIFYAMFKFFEPSVARIIPFEGGKKHRTDRL